MPVVRYYDAATDSYKKLKVYRLPAATTDTLGGVKVGNGLEVDENGVLSAKQPLAEYSGQSGAIENTVEAPCYVTDFPVNLLKITEENQTVSGVTFTVNKTEGTVTVNGTATAYGAFYVSRSIPIAAGNYFIKQESLKIQLRIMNEDGSVRDVFPSQDGTVVTIDYDTVFGYVLYFDTGDQFNNTIVYPSLIKGTKSRGFVPYGGGTIKTTGKNLLNIPETLEITQYIDKQFSMPLKAGTYILSGGTYHTDDDNIAINFQDINGNYYYNVFPKNQQFKITITFTADVTNFYAYARATYDTAAGKTATLKNYMLSQSDGDFEPYQESEIFLAPDTPLPAAGLKTFDGVTNIFSNFDVDLKYFKDTEKAVPDAALENKINIVLSHEYGAANHNTKYVEKDITDMYDNGRFSENIANQSFVDIWLGNTVTKPVTIEGTTYQVTAHMADCNLYYGGYNFFAITSTPHIAAILTGLPKKPMNSTSSTVGAYKGSEMYIWLKDIVLPALKASFGAGHFVSHLKLLSTVMTDTAFNKAAGQHSGASTNWKWIDNQEISLLTEIQVRGGTVWSSSGFDTGEACKKLAIFNLINPQKLVGNDWWWLRDVVTASHFATYVATAASFTEADAVGEVHPLILLK